jgi:hypothetical protein
MAKPVSDILVLHANGQWGRKVKGKMVYFGSNQAKAYSLWLEDKPYLLAGETPPRAYGPPAALQLAEYYADRLKRSVAYGKVGERHAKLVTIVLRRFLSIVGYDCQLSSLSPLEWADVREKLFAPVKRDRPVRADATALAQTLSMMPPMQRQQELKVLRERHKTFHGIVRGTPGTGRPSERPERQNGDDRRMMNFDRITKLRETKADGFSKSDINTTCTL